VNDLVANPEITPANTELHMRIPCVFVAGTLTADPAKAPDGDAGHHGTNGQDRHPWKAARRGDMAVVGPFTVTGSDGGDGGAGRDASDLRENSAHKSSREMTRC
jgi:hypothetical protein